MKSSPAMILALFATIPMLLAQSSTPVPLPSSEATPSEKPLSLMPSPAPSNPSPNTELPLIPPIPILPGDSSQKRKKQQTGPSKTDAAEDAMQLHIKLRAAKTKALEDPLLQVEFDKAKSAKTDYDQREAYKRYYVLLYARMLKIDPTIATGILGREASSLYHQYQWRVAATIPHDQIGLAKPIGPKNALNAGNLPMGTPPPRRFFGQARIGASQ